MVFQSKNTPSQKDKKYIITKQYDFPSKFIIYDYETYGNKARDTTISEVAFLTVDTNGKEAEESRNEIRVIPPGDKLPSIDASLVTKISIKDLQKKAEVGVDQYTERELAYILNSWITASERTCLVGYNNISFDDVITEHLFYKNFIDPYAFRWDKGNTRIDLLNLTIAFHSLCPNLLHYPKVTRDGSTFYSYKLEDISFANNLIHDKPHAAISDVIACKDLLSRYLSKDLISNEKEVDGELKTINTSPRDCFKYLYKFTNKSFVVDFIDKQGKTAFINFSNFLCRELRGAVPVVCLSNWGRSNNRLQEHIFLNLNTPTEELREFLNLSRIDIEKFFNIGYQFRKFRTPIFKLKANQFPLFAKLDDCLFNTELQAKDVKERIERNLELLKEYNLENILEILLEVRDYGYLKNLPQDDTPLYLVSEDSVKKYLAELDTEQKIQDVRLRPTYKYINKVNSPEMSLLVLPETKLIENLSLVFNNKQLFKAELGPDIERFLPHLSFITQNPSLNNLFILYIGDTNISELTEELKIYYLKLKELRLEASFEEFNNSVKSKRREILKNNNLSEETVAEIKKIIKESEDYYAERKSFYEQAILELTKIGE